MVFPPLSLLFIVSSVSLLRAAWTQRTLLTQHWKPHYWYVLTHALFFFAVITVGVVHADKFGVVWLNTLMYGSFASCAFWVWRMREFRWFAGSLVALMEVPVLGAVFLVGISVTGDIL
jgi:hypothetical protein